MHTSREVALALNSCAHSHAGENRAFSTITHSCAFNSISDSIDFSSLNFYRVSFFFLCSQSHTTHYYKSETQYRTKSLENDPALYEAFLCENHTLAIAISASIRQIQLHTNARPPSPSYTRSHRQQAHALSPMH